jgi:hypothetical protein
MRQLIKLLLVNFGVFCVLIIILEGLLATFRPIKPLWNDNLSNMGWRWSDSPYRAALIATGLRGPRFWSEHEANQFGFRGRKIKYGDEDYVVLLVGDSQVEAAGSYFEELPEIILERSLTKITQKKARVFSIGASGWSQDQQLLALREYFQQFRADLVVLWHTPINDFWENAFPDRSLGSAQQGAGPLKPTFLLLDNQQGGERIELFHPPVPEHAILHLLHRLNTGRAVLKLLVALGIIDIKNIQPNEVALRAWLPMIPPAGGHKTVAQSQCPAEIVPQGSFSPYHDEYTDRALTMETLEAIEESRSSFTPFLEPSSLRDEYTKRITYALVESMKALVEVNGAEFRVFAPKFTFNGVPFFSEIRCVKKHDKFYRMNSDLLAPMEASKASVNFMKLIIEIGQYGVKAVEDRGDEFHLNFLGNRLVMEALAERIHSSGWPNSIDVLQHSPR